MATNPEKILEFLRLNPREYCDDCLSNLAKVTNRHQVNQICRRLVSSGFALRRDGSCHHCGAWKLTTRVGGSTEVEEDINNVEDANSNPQGGTAQRLSPRDFEAVVGRLLKDRFSMSFSETALRVGPGKQHKFDIVSSDRSVVAECKSYTWTSSGNRPSAKFSTALEAVFYLSRINADHKLLVFQDDIREDLGSLAEVFAREMDALLDDVEVLAYRQSESGSGKLHAVRKPKSSWYASLLATDSV